MVEHASLERQVPMRKQVAPLQRRALVVAHRRRRPGIARKAEEGTEREVPIDAVAVIEYPQRHHGSAKIVQFGTHPESPFLADRAAYTDTQMRRNYVSILQRRRFLRRGETAEIQPQAPTAHPNIDKALEPAGLRGVFKILRIGGQLCILAVDFLACPILIAAIKPGKRPEAREALAVDVLADIQSQTAGIAVARLRVLGRQHVGAAVVNAWKADEGRVALVLQRPISQI